MIYHASPLAVAIFLALVGFVLALSFWLGRRAKDSSGYFAAHGQIPWFVNGVAFAGDYLSAASFLGICGMIAFYGYDGFLYSIGFLAGWVVALFVIAEPIKRLGRFTFADALDAKFNSRGIKLAAAVSTLFVSIFYLIPQMVGAGSLVVPLLGIPYWAGVLIIGTIVTLIVVTAGMVSTTWVQFIKGGMLVVFCTILVAMVLNRGVTSKSTFQPENIKSIAPGKSSPPILTSTLDIREIFATGPDPLSGHAEPSHHSPLGYLQDFRSSTFSTYSRTVEGETVSGGFQLPGHSTILLQHVSAGSDLLLPGGSPTFKGVRSPRLFDKVDFISLMLALFCGTASLPHILIRYYTVKDQSAARKSTVVGIFVIGFFYLLTLYIGLGAMVSGALDPTNSTMAAPLLARTFGPLPFAIISAIAFTTVLGTVSGLILAASGAIVHDLMKNYAGMKMSDKAQVKYAKLAAIAVGVIAMLLGLAFKEMNPAFLVGWAFNVAASANLPALVMLLFWSRTTKQGITASIFVGLFTSLAWLLLSPQCFKDVYHLDPAKSFIPFSQPGLITIPLSFLVLVVGSLLTTPPAKQRGFEVKPI